MKNILCFLTLVALLSACNSSNKKGTSISIQFERYGEIPDSAWIKVDDITFIHSPHNFEWNTAVFLPGEEPGQYLSYLPTSQVYYYLPDTEKRFSEKHNNQATMLLMRRKLEAYDKSDVKYRCTNEKELMINGKLVFEREDGKPIKIEASKDNPLKIIKL